MATAKTLTVNQMAAAFGVTTMTLYLWRQGTPTKDPLPHHTLHVGEKQVPRLSFKIGETKTWAKKHGIEFKIDPAKILATPNGDEETVSKPVSKVSKSTAKRKKH